jgi:hypothetical protein
MRPLNFSNNSSLIFYIFCEIKVGDERLDFYGLESVLSLTFSSVDEGARSAAA